jgi:hypothetical protein
VAVAVVGLHKYQQAVLAVQVLSYFVTQIPTQLHLVQE